MRLLLVAIALLLLAAPYTYAQRADTLAAVPVATPAPKRLMRWEIGDGRYIQATFMNQTWARWSELNPGSTVAGKPASDVFDISLRRTRIQLFGQIHPRVFFYTQLGMNNFSFNAVRKTGLFFHDALGEVALVPTKLHLGAGLTAWGGPLRFTAPSVASILGLDAPIYQQINNDVNDQFDRRLALYLKGTVGRVNYRAVMARPMLLANATAGVDALGSARVPAGVATFNPHARQLQYSGYAAYNFFDIENPVTPYMAGTYLGTKRVLSVGIGALYQADAMYYARPNSPDTVTAAQLEIGADVFYEQPIGSAGQALNVYAAYHLTDAGPDYVRNLGPNNPVTAAAASPTAFNGTGIAFPMFGTGSTVYAQAGWKFKNNLLGKLGTLQVYASTQTSRFTRLKDPMVYIDAGATWLLVGHTAKVTVAYQSRPVFTTNPTTNGIEATRRRGAVVLQLQVFVE